MPHRGEFERGRTPVGTLVIHAGMPNAGTTYIQSVLMANRRTLSEHGVSVPGETRRDQGRVRAAFRAGPGSGDFDAAQRVLNAASADGARVVISNEWFTRLPRRR
jgi:hypothetical protein